MKKSEVSWPDGDGDGKGCLILAIVGAGVVLLSALGAGLHAAGVL